jgi:isoleucyl-tRNA synthetase
MKIKSWHEVKRFKATDLENLNTKHPLYERTSPFILGEHVLMTDGTGLVHTAPAHGIDDYIVGKRYGLEVFNPVDDNGRFKETLSMFGGMDIYEANPKIIEALKNNGTLVTQSVIKHSYPHCWRCKKPVIYRATPQWFISMDVNDLRQKTLNAITNDVKWIPRWGYNRIYSMVESRPDWCISRQRIWGVPIALIKCGDCEKIITNKEIQERVLNSFRQKGADAWFEEDISTYLSGETHCPHCGSTKLEKETDILDVWFDSGTSHAAVCEARDELKGVADMYLEGTDQHRGWFHSSILESIATRGKPPFREVLTHGFVVTEDLQKMSKSLGNVITPEELIKNYGAEVLRLWVAAEDYSNDVRISNDILNRLVESYRKIRNTCRYMLGNLYDFNPDTDLLPFDKLNELDRYAILLWQACVSNIYQGYGEYQFHIFYHTFINFCINDLSSFYLDIIKDRLYSFGANSKERRSAQSAVFTILKDMAIVMSPVLSFTADEIWDYLPVWQEKHEFVFEELFPKADLYKDEMLREKFARLLVLRKVVNKALETARVAKLIGHPLDAKVLIKAKLPKQYELDEGLTRFLIVSEAVFCETVDDGIVEGDLTVKAVASEAPKCTRCWTHSETVRNSSEELCERCAEVLVERE